MHVGRHELYTEITSGSHASHEQFGSFMGRVKPKEQDGPSRFDAWANISQSFRQPRWKMYELEFEKGRDEKVQVFGHYIVATGGEIWCIGGFRPCERAKISLLKLKLHSKCWDDLTPPDNAIAPAWRWGHFRSPVGFWFTFVYLFPSVPHACQHVSCTHVLGKINLTDLMSQIEGTLTSNETTN